MKAKTLLLTALTAVTLGASAQDEKPRYEFNPYWSLQVQGGIGYDARTLKNFGDFVSPAAAISLGYRFSPAVGARLHVSGLNGKQLVKALNAPYKWSYGQAGLDAVIDINSLIAGYNPNRVLTINAILGIGYIHGFKNEDAQKIYATNPKFLPYTWNDDKFNSISGRAGLQADLRLSKRLSFNLEGLVSAMGDKFNSQDGKRNDWHVNAFAGLTYRFGNINTEPINTYVPVPVIPAPVPVEDTPAPEPAPAPVPEPAPAPQPVKVQSLSRNVFFQINSAKISATEMLKVNEVVAYLSANPNAKVEVTGYADKNTGNATINQRISQQRANAVYNELLKQKISANRIIKNAKGDTEQPFKANDDNRVVICIAE